MNRLREFRQAAGLTQTQLAQRAKVSSRTVFGIERSDAACQQYTKRRLLRGLRMEWARKAEVWP